MIDLPYISQWDEEAKASKNDCGSVSLTMILRKYGETYTADEIFKMTGAGAGYISFQQLIAVSLMVGYKAEYKERQTTEYLRRLIDSGICPIVLVQYGFLKSTQDKNFKGPHLFVLRGYRADGYFVNDPNFWGQFRNDGNGHFYTKEEFESAWRSTTTDSNSPNSILVVYPKQISPMPTQISQEQLEYYKDKEKKGLEFEKLTKHHAEWNSAQALLDYESNINKQFERKDQIIQNLNTQIHDRNNQITKLQSDISTKDTQVANLTTQLQLAQEQALKVKPLEDQFEEAKKEKQLWIGNEQRYIKQIKTFQTKFDYVNKPLHKLLIDLLFTR